jgi:glycosyltransferase XagB
MLALRETSSEAPESQPTPLTTAGGNRLAETPLPGEFGYSFLLDSGLSTAQLLEAVDHARAAGVSVPDALVATGHLSEDAYAALVARALTLPHVADIEVERVAPLVRIGRDQIRQLVVAGAAPVYALPASAGPLHVLEQLARTIAAQGGVPVVVAPSVLVAAIERAERSRMLRRAILGLRRTSPDLSASRPPALWQIVAIMVMVGVFVGAMLITPGHAVAVLMVLLLMPFLGVVTVRSAALAMLWRPRETAAAQPLRAATATPDDQLPVYSVLVPLFDEPAVVRDLVKALTALDYPTSKVDVTLILEEVDLTTKLALLALPLPHNFRLVVVPDGLPRTKPKALNYAMQMARGDYVVVYDAEDRPEPDQLRKAVAVFRDGPVDLACVQAKLNLYNPRDSWLSRQFTVEYSALFDAILPALAWLRLPVPLGGTSNHFPRALLDAIGGWDPFNVTEDADLGIRLARLGYSTAIVDSTTWEEAPVTWRQWLPQRTRWLKGWYQTYLVHNRRPRQLLRDLGWYKLLGFHMFLGGVILSTLIHPLFYLLLLLHMLGGDMFALPVLVQAPMIWVASMLTLGLGYGSAIAVGVIAGRRRGHGLGRAALFMPLYWLLVSVAAYRALWQLWRDPFLWEKTRHGATASG